MYFIEISCPADINIVLKEEEKLSNYHDLAIDFQHTCGMLVTIIPVVLGRTSVVSLRYMNHIRKIPEFSPRLYLRKFSLAYQWYLV